MNIKRLLLGKNWWEYYFEIHYSFSTHNSKEEIEGVYKVLEQGHHYSCCIRPNCPREFKKVLDDGRTIYSSTFSISIFPKTYNPRKIYKAVQYVMNECGERLELNQGHVGICFNKMLFVDNEDIPF